MEHQPEVDIGVVELAVHTGGDAWSGERAALAHCVDAILDERGACYVRESDGERLEADWLVWRLAVSSERGSLLVLGGEVPGQHLTPHRFARLVSRRLEVDTRVGRTTYAATTGRRESTKITTDAQFVVADFEGSAPTLARGLGVSLRLLRQDDGGALLLPEGDGVGSDGDVVRNLHAMRACLNGVVLWRSENAAGLVVIRDRKVRGARIWRTAFPIASPHNTDLHERLREAPADPVMLYRGLGLEASRISELREAVEESHPDEGIGALLALLNLHTVLDRRLRLRATASPGVSVLTAGRARVMLETVLRDTCNERRASARSEQQVRLRNAAKDLATALGGIVLLVVLSLWLPTILPNLVLAPWIVLWTVFMPLLVWVGLRPSLRLLGEAMDQRRLIPVRAEIDASR
ncbi:MAG: hypothetical protein LBE60_14505 [Microbacterium sp.]|jgi:hypothetical protein|uniref:hypothetical protein n=1 Tax=Microbacterium sp. TaxID=51671 RepID=UPI00282D54E1|nr:hypothetical protein [Microbacterium sp.]MDR2322844.1 hypothetical protein [Microbacterium sp.]